VPEEKRAAALGGTVQKIMCLKPTCGCGGRPPAPFACD